MLDNSVCGVYARCVTPEKTTFPTARDVMRAYPIRSSRARLKSFSLDIKSANKRISVLPSHRGLLGFTFQHSYSSTMCARSGRCFQRIFGADWEASFCVYFIHLHGCLTLGFFMWMTYSCFKMRPFFRCQQL